MPTIFSAQRIAHKLVLAFAALLCACLTAPSSAQEVIPDFYREPGLQPNRDYVNQGFSEHIDPFTGGLQLHYVDLHLPGNGRFDLKVIRSYNSAAVDPANPAAAEDTFAGLGWSIHFGRVLKSRDTLVCSNTNASTATDNPVLETPDGSRQLLSFTGGTSPLMLTTQRWRADCITGGSGGLAVYAPDGMRYDMTQFVNVGTALRPIYAWYTTAITDRNGNSATIQYSGALSQEISGVTTSDGRSVSFAYAGSGTTQRRVTSISGASRTYTYAYQAISGVPNKYFLQSVTRPGGTAWTYAYNASLGSSAGSYVMNAMVYPEGGSHGYAYGFAAFDAANSLNRSTVVTSKATNTGASWSFSYTPGSFGVTDSTSVTSPTGVVTYRHVGPNYSSSGTVWMVGLLTTKTIGSAQSETYVWDKQSISTESYSRPGAFASKVDIGVTNAPVLKQRVIVRDGATYTTDFSNFDAYGNPQTVAETGTNGGNRTASLSYYINTSKWIVRQVKDESFSGSSITRSFDGNGNMLSVTNNGVSTSHSYDSQGNVSSTVFPRGLSHSYSNYYRGIARSETRPELITLSRVVDDAGNVTSETNGDGFITAYTYDGLNRLTAIAYPQGNPVQLSYTAASKTATRGSLVEATIYDGFGRPSSVTLGGIARSYVHDALGRMTFRSNPGSSSLGTGYTYDILDRTINIANADGTATSISYGAASRSVMNERFKTTTYSYRAYGDPGRAHLMSIVSPEAGTNISIARNSVDLVTSATQGGFTRSYGYAPALSYHLTSTVEPETGTTTYGRDAAGNMTSKSVGGAAASNYTYDNQNRLTQVLHPAGTPSVTNTYNKRGRMTASTSTAAGRVLVYDANGNLTSESLNIDGGTGTVGYTYNANDQLQSISYPLSGMVVNYAPDVLGRPTQVSGFATAVGYWPSGHVSQISYGNGVVTQYGQNSRLWTSSFVTSRAGQSFTSTGYSYDGKGNLTAVTDSVDAGYNRSLAYDNIDRMTGFNGSWGTGALTYSAVGNLLSQSAPGFLLAYTYDANNRLASMAGNRVGSFSYDANGNVIAIGATTYAYDSVPNLTCANCSDALTRVDYAYDGLGRRVSATKAGIKTYEMYDLNGNLLFEYNGATGRSVDHIYLGGRRIAQRVSP